MLDIKLIREDVEKVIKKLNTRGQDYSYLREIISLDEDKRKIQQEVDTLRAFRNEASKEIGKLKSQKMNADELIAKVNSSAEKISTLELKQKELDDKVFSLLAKTPNMLNDNVKIGKDEKDNQEIRKWGEPKKFSFTPKPHWDLGVELDILDFDRAAKITGSRFTVYKGLGARLERAIINFMLDTHAKKGYKEIFPPLMVNTNSAFGTGQLPKFEEDLFKLEQGYYLIPTAEVPVTNLHRDEILKAESLPIYYTAYTPCFRSEAGSAGRDTRGIIRQHQFNKIELVKFTTPETSYQELEKLTSDAEKILQLLRIPYRVIQLCTGDSGFASATTYDIEVWLPSYNAYKEISSCSNFEDFQARRANIKFKRSVDSKPEFVHTLNGSALAVGRTTAAVIENYQNEDGTITIPDVLIPYMGTNKIEK